MLNEFAFQSILDNITGVGNRIDHRNLWMSETETQAYICIQQFRTQNTLDLCVDLDFPLSGMIACHGRRGQGFGIVW